MQLQYTIANQAKQFTHQCNTESCVGHCDHSGIQYTMQYQAEQYIHLLNTKSWVHQCDDSGIWVHDRISGWSYHPSIQYPGRFQPFAHKCNTESCVSHHDHSSILLYDRIPGWEPHSSIEYLLVCWPLWFFQYSGTQWNIWLIVFLLCMGPLDQSDKHS